MAALSFTPAAAGQEGPAPASGAGGISREAASITVKAGEGARQSLVAPTKSAAAQRLQVDAVTFDVTYIGFTRSARRSFQAAVNIWAAQVDTSVPITVRATFEPLGTRVLGQAGPSRVHRDFAGAPQRNTWYADAVANKRAGRNLDPSPDIRASFSSNQPDWYFGTDGNTPSGQYDFKTVVLHELGHGLGFLGAGSVNELGQGTVRLNRLPISYDRYTENGSGESLLGFPDSSTSLGNQLTSNAVYFDSAAVRDANGGARARLFAPGGWDSGSSYSHLNEATYPQGNPNSLMTPTLNDAEAIHSPGLITLAMFRAIGW
jgi:hypothetical protein